MYKYYLGFKVLIFKYLSFIKDFNLWGWSGRGRGRGSGGGSSG